MKEWITEASKYLYETPYGNLRSDSCVLPNGTKIDDYYVHEYPDWVNIIAINENNELLLVKQYRQGVRDFFLEIVAGSVKSGEHHEETAIRELEEETGYICIERPILMGAFYCNPAIQNNKIYMYYCDKIKKSSIQQLDDTEEIETISIPFNVIDNYINDGSISQLFSVTAINMVKERKR